MVKTLQLSVKLSARYRLQFYDPHLSAYLGDLMYLQKLLLKTCMVIQWNRKRVIKRLFSLILMHRDTYKRLSQHVPQILYHSHGQKVSQMVVHLCLITESTLIKLLEHMLFELLKLQVHRTQPQALLLD